MKQYVLNNGVSIPCIGYGTFPQKNTLINNIGVATDCGYTLIDTSDNYANEYFVGQGFAKTELTKKSNVIIVSKFSQPYRTDDMEKCFAESLNRLTKLDIYLLHWPYPFLWKLQWKKMENLYLDGKVSAIGVCNFEKKHIKKLLKFCKVKPVINQIEVHPMFQQKDTVDFCEKNDIKVMSYSPIARMNSSLIDNPVLLEIASKYKKSVVQVILRWNIELGYIPLPASSNPKHIVSNLDIFDFTLLDDDKEKIGNLEAGLRVRYSPSNRFTLKEKILFWNYRVKLMLRGVVKKNNRED